MVDSPDINLQPHRRSYARRAAKANGRASRLRAIRSGLRADTVAVRPLGRRELRQRVQSVSNPRRRKIVVCRFEQGQCHPHQIDGHCVSAPTGSWSGHLTGAVAVPRTEREPWRSNDPHAAA